MVGGNELRLSVVWLTTLHRLFSVYCMWGQLVGPIHPVDAGVDMVFVAGPDFEDPGDPIVIRLFLLAPFSAGWRFLPVDKRLVSHVNEALAKILDAIH